MRIFVSKNHIWGNVVAGVLCLAMVVCDASLLGLLNGAQEENTEVITEEHKMDEYLVDGDYGGNKSDYENMSNWGKVSGAAPKYGIFNILEIVPDTRCGYVGYMEEGCEPVSDDPLFRGYILDAMVNNVPGSQYDAYQNQYYFNSKFGNINTGSTRIVDQEQGTYDGYFLKVASGTGVYALNTSGTTYTSAASGKRDDDEVSNVIMVSLYAEGGGAYNSSYPHGTYDYVWVETNYGSNAEKPKTTRHQMNNLAEGDKIYVYNYRKCKYKNNNLMGELLYGDSSVDPASIKVFTRTPAQLVDEPDLVQNVDMIFLSEDVDTYSTSSFNAYKVYNGDGGSVGKYSSSNDIPFDQVMTIYDRVVNDEDCALVASHAFGLSGSLNIHKLIFMLFAVDDKDYNKSHTGNVAGSGRAFFNNFIPAFKNKAEEIAKVSNDGGKTYTESVYGSDFVYIGDDGTYNVSSNYSGAYFNEPDEGWKWDISGYVTTGDTDWHKNDFDGKWLLAWASGTNGKKYDNHSFPLYAHFDKKYKINYSLPTNCSYKNQYMHNDNGMTFRCGNGGLLNDIAKTFSDNAKNKKITPDPNTEGDTKSRIVYLTVNIKNGSSKSSGDTTSDSYIPNKNMYINQYELDNNKIKDEFVFDFTIKSTTPVTSVKATIGTNSYEFAYSGSTSMSGENLTKPTHMADYLNYKHGSTSLDLTCVGINTGTMADVAAKIDAAIAADTSHSIYPAGFQYEVADIYEYNGKLKVNDFYPDFFTNVKPNTPVTIEVFTDLDTTYNDGTTGKLTAKDTMKIVVRNFFQLN